MIALDLMFAALTQATGPGATPAEGVSPAPIPNVEVVGPASERRVICHTLTPSGSHITARRVCRTVAQIESARDRAQLEAEEDVRSSNQRTNNMLVRSPISQGAPAIGMRDVRQERRGGD